MFDKKKKKKKNDNVEDWSTVSIETVDSSVLSRIDNDKVEDLALRLAIRDEMYKEAVDDLLESLQKQQEMISIFDKMVRTLEYVAYVPVRMDSGDYNFQIAARDALAEVENFKMFQSEDDNWEDAEDFTHWDQGNKNDFSF